MLFRSQQQSWILLPLLKCLLFTRPGQHFLLTSLIFVTSIVGFIGAFTGRSTTHALFSLCYKQALLSSIVLFASFYFSVNALSFSSLKNMLKHSDGQYMILCLIFLTSSSHTYLIMFLLIVLSLCLMCNIMVSKLVPLHIQSINESLAIRLKQWFRFIANKETYPQMMKMIARIEILLFASHVFNIFLGNIQLMRTVMLFQFLTARYSMSTHFRATCQDLGATVHQLLTHPSCPSIVTRYYHQLMNWMRGFMNRMQHTMRQYQQQQQQQQQ